MAERIAFHTGQTVEQIEQDSDRDRWFTAEEAKAYGLIDEVRSRKRSFPPEHRVGLVAVVEMLEAGTRAPGASRSVSCPRRTPRRTSRPGTHAAGHRGGKGVAGLGDDTAHRSPALNGRRDRAERGSGGRRGQARNDDHDQREAPQGAHPRADGQDRRAVRHGAPPRRRRATAPAPAHTDHGYRLRGGVHPETANIANVLHHHGFPISEAMVLGIGGGLGAGYILWEFAAHDQPSTSSLGFRNRWNYIDWTRARRSTGSASVPRRTTTGGARAPPRRSTAVLDAGGPAIVVAGPPADRLLAPAAAPGRPRRAPGRRLRRRPATACTSTTATWRR